MSPRENTKESYRSTTHHLSPESSETNLYRQVFWLSLLRRLPFLIGKWLFAEYSQCEQDYSSGDCSGFSPDSLLSPLYLSKTDT